MLKTTRGKDNVKRTTELEESVAAEPRKLLGVVSRGELLASLNLDLPRYSENLRPKRLTQVAGLAMIPVGTETAPAGSRVKVMLFRALEEE